MLGSLWTDATVIAEDIHENQDKYENNEARSFQGEQPDDFRQLSSR